MPYRKKPDILERDQIPVAKPLAFNIYSGLSNKLLLAEGEEVRDISALDRLIANKAYRVLNENEFYIDYDNRKQPFDGIEYLSHRVRYLLKKPANNNTGDFEQKLFLLAEEIFLYTFHYPDQSIALGQVWKSDDYSTYHPIQAAILCGILAHSLEWREMDIIQLIAAALVMNISMSTLQEDLHGRRTQLDESDHRQIHNHPLKSVQILSGCGIESKKYPLMIKAILQHHEKIDGSGYPGQIKGDKISDAALILNICDRYTAFTSERISRVAYGSAQAVKNIFRLSEEEQQDSRYKSFAHQMVRELGLHPPGTMVRLSDQSVAVILKRNSKSINDKPIVAQLRSPGNMAYARPAPLNLKKSKIVIERILDEKPMLDLRVRNLFLQKELEPVFIP